jgi:hypothetical protein
MIASSAAEPMILRARPARGSRQLIVLLPVVLLALLAMWRVTVQTGDGLRMYNDSGVYLGIADNVRSGHGLSVPFSMPWDTYSPTRTVAYGTRVPSTHIPPGYPLALAVTSIVTGTARHAARLLDIVLIAANVVLLGALTARMTQYRSAVVALIPPALCLFVADTRLHAIDDDGWFLSHLGAASEPLYMAATSASLLLIAAALTRPSMRTRLMQAAGFGAMALLTRYSGVAVLVTGVVALFWLGRRRRDAGIFAAIVVGPTLLFLIVERIAHGEGARPLSYHRIMGVDDVVAWLGRYLFPLSMTSWLRGGAALLVCGFVAAALVWSPARVGAAWTNDDHGIVLARVCGLFIVSFVGVLLITGMFFDRQARITPRLLAPARGIFLALVVALGYRWLAPYLHARRAQVFLAVAAVGLIWSGWSAQHHWFDVNGARNDGPVDLAVRGLPSETMVLSQDPARTYMTDGRAAYYLPDRTIYLTGAPNRRFEQDMLAWAAMLNARGGYVEIDKGFLPSTVIGIDELRRYVNLRLIADSGDRQLYEVVRS